MRARSVLALAGLAAASAGSGSPAAHPQTWTSFPTATPNQGWPDGPIFGNGNIGVSIGGGKGSITAYVTVHGFWSAANSTAAPMPPLAAERDGLGFPGCPADNCTITVGLTLAAVTISSPTLAAAASPGWNATVDIAGATGRISINDGVSNGNALSLEVYVSATEQVVLFNLQNVGSGALRDVNVSSWANGNTARVAVAAQCADGTTAAPAACPTSAGGPPVAHFVTKDASPAGSNFPITGAFALRPVSTDNGVTLSAAPQLYTATVPHAAWSTGKTVDTETVGATTVLSLVAGAGVRYAASAAASRDPGVYPLDPGTAVQARVAAVSASTLPALASAHAAWWAAFWSASAVDLGDTAVAAGVEAYWYGSLYALGSGSRAGQVVQDLWSPWRTTDYSLWRSNPTMDYNQQALYSAIFAANHPDLAAPYFDFLKQALDGGGPQAESAALGCPGGVHLSVDLAPFGLKLGTWGVPQDWGIRTNGAYAAWVHSQYFYTTPLNASWITTVAWPYLTGVAAYWQCTLVKVPTPGAPDGYLWVDVDDCTGDEGCKLPAAQRTGPMWGVLYIQRLFQTLVDMSHALGRTPDAAWLDILAHWPPVPTTFYAPATTGSTAAAPVPVLAWYANSSYLNWGGQSNNLHALWPGEAVDLGTRNATLLAAARNSFNFTAWSQSNSFNWVYPAAARAGVAPTVYLSKLRTQLASLVRPNQLVAWGGACSDTLGTMQVVADALVQRSAVDGVLRLFPAWPGNETASFRALRMRGAVLVSAFYSGGSQWAGTVAGRTGGTVNATITAEAPGTLTVLSPWPAAGSGGAIVCDVTATAAAAADAAGAGCPSGSPVALTWANVGGSYGGPGFSWTLQPGSSYLVLPAAA